MNVPFDREAVFAAVDASSKRFETYTDAERAEFAKVARQVREQIPVRPMFTLASDQDDVGGKFADLTNEQVIAAAQQSAIQMMKWCREG